MIETNRVLDAKGLACPMPIVKTKKVMKEIEMGEVLEVQATDKGSTADLKAWSESAKHQYLGTIEEDGVLKHYLRKSGDDDKQEKKHPHVVSNEELLEILDSSSNVLLLDVRESAEFAFGHIPGAKSVPLGNIENELNKLDKKADVYVVCRTGNRSDLVAQKLSVAGFEKVTNVVPGMSEWKSPIEKLLSGV
ncbi:sulfurtransferase TusA family protein [Sporosarcina sp. CAU 1771]